MQSRSQHCQPASKLGRRFLAPAPPCCLWARCFRNHRGTRRARPEPRDWRPSLRQPSPDLRNLPPVQTGATRRLPQLVPSRLLYPVRVWLKDAGLVPRRRPFPVSPLARRQVRQGTRVNLAPSGRSIRLHWHLVRCTQKGWCRRRKDAPHQRCHWNPRGVCHPHCAGPRSHQDSRNREEPRQAQGDL